MTRRAKLALALSTALLAWLAYSGWTASEAGTCLVLDESRCTCAPISPLVAVNADEYAWVLDAMNTLRGHRTALLPQCELDKLALTKARNQASVWLSEWRDDLVDRRFQAHRLGLGGMLYKEHLLILGYPGKATEVVAGAPTALCQELSLECAWQSLIGSPPHLAAMTDELAREIGIGVAWADPTIGPVFLVIYMGGG